MKKIEITYEEKFKKFELNSDFDSIKDTYYTLIKVMNLIESILFDKECEAKYSNHEEVKVNYYDED